MSQDGPNDPVDHAELAVWHAHHEAPWFIAVGVGTGKSGGRCLHVYVRSDVPPEVIWPPCVEIEVIRHEVVRGKKRQAR